MSYSTQVLADTPVGYWRLGESSGTSATDASGNGLTGTYEGSFSLGQTSLSGEANTAASLTGGSGRVNCGNPSQLQIVGNVTVEVLVKLNAVPANGVRVLAGKGLQGGPSREGYVLRIYKDASNYVLTFVSYDDPNEYDISIPITWAAGETYHVVGRHLAGQRSIWVNGVKVVEAAKAQGAIATSAPFLIGAESQFGSITAHLDATYDEVAVYNYGLSDARIAAHYAEIGGPPPTAATLDSAVVSANGVDVVANFSTAVSGVVLNQFNIVSAGKPVPILSVSGAGTATLTFRLAKSWIAAGDTVRLSYFGSGLTSVGGAPVPAKVTATNSSAVSRKKTRYVDREFGMFIHCSSASYNMPYNPTTAQMNLFNPVNLNVGQWLDAAVGAGMKYAVLTTKHDGGFCIWPSATTPRGIISTSWYAATQIDIVREFVNGCRSRGLGVGLYINFYDPYYKDERPGATGDYTGFTSYISAQITELLTNYGQIDLLWIDSWHYRPEVSYSVVPYATIQTLVNTLQPNCAMVNNARGSESFSEVAITEGSGAPDVPPVAGNLKPVEFVETSNSNNIWEWNAANDANLKPALVLVKQLEEIKQARGCYVVNFSPDRDGVFSAAQLAVLSAIGEAVGQQGGTKLPARTIVKLGENRGDGELGLLAGGNGGINGSAILGMP